jgi:hypothetical protein
MSVYKLSFSTVKCWSNLERQRVGGNELSKQICNWPLFARLILRRICKPSKVKQLLEKADG